MTDPRFDQIREDLRALKGRTARGEIDEPTYFRLKEELLSELTPQERQAVESPAPRRDPASGPLRPAGGRGEAVRTWVPSLAELDLAVGTVLFEQLTPA
jgi:hypothetical protein